jgi:cysteine desulfurase
VARLRGLDGIQETGHPSERLPGIVSVVIAGVDGASLVMALDLAGLACSTGSACVTGSAEASHVLTAMGYPEDEAKGALRLSLGRTSTAEEIEQAGRLIVGAVETQRVAAARLEAAARAFVSMRGSASEATAG